MRPPCGIELLVRLTICFFEFPLFVMLVISHFVYEDTVLVLIVTVSCHCLFFYFENTSKTNTERMSADTTK